MVQRNPPNAFAVFMLVLLSTRTGMCQHRLVEPTSVMAAADSTVDTSSGPGNAPPVHWIPAADFSAEFVSPTIWQPAEAAGEGNGPEASDIKSETERPQAQQPSVDQQMVARGRAAFEQSCTQCHDADRALQKSKSKAGWLTTVRRMARMEDADIAAADIEPIATYLASRNAPPSPSSSGNGADASAPSDGGEEAALSFGSGLGISGTLSTLWRGGNDNLENPDFFPDVWLTADWQPNGPLRGRVTACTSCHSDNTNGSGFTLELVEGYASWDLLYGRDEQDQRIDGCEPCLEAEVKAGRIIVPFGAYSAMSHPGIYRTVTNPLMYNMGRQVAPNRSRPPVLPMPYSDEGADLDVKLALTNDLNATMDVFVVNGLQAGGTGIQFSPSRSYTDNNRQPAVGGRATIGCSRFRIGGSVMSGRMQDDMSPTMDYRFAGADITGRLFDDLVRLYFEYAIRRNDSSLEDQQITYGAVYELEFLLYSDPNVNALIRYDTLEYRDLFGDDSIERFTWGVSTTAIGGSLLIANHERWNFTGDQEDVDVVGVRWVVAF